MSTEGKGNVAETRSQRTGLAAAVPPLPRLQGKAIAGLLVIPILLYLIGGPIIMLLISSFKETGDFLPLSPRASWSLGNYVEVFSDPGTYRLLGTTLIFCGGTILAVFALGLTFALLVERTNLPGRNIVAVLIIMPMGIQFLIMGISWSLLLDPTNGLLNVLPKRYLDQTFNIYSLPGMILVQTTSLVPVAFLLLSSGLRHMSTSFEDAAATCGSGRIRTLVRVTLPLIAPLLTSVVIYLFVTVVETVDVPLVLGLPGDVRVLSTNIYLLANPPTGLPNYGITSTFGVFLFILALGPLVIYNRIMSHPKSYATVGGKAYRSRRLDLGRWRVPALVGVLIYTAMSFGLPALTLLWVSLQPFFEGTAGGLQPFTVEAYEVWLRKGTLTAAGHTLVVGIFSALGAMLLSVVVSWLVVRVRSRAVRSLDTLAFIPHAMPSVVIGLSVLLIYLAVPLPIFGTVWIIVIAIATQYVALGTRLTTGSIAQIHESLEEAAGASGAAAHRTWRHILVPLLRRPFISGFLLVFLLTIQNLTLPLMLSSPGNAVLSTFIYSHWVGGDVAGVAALSVGILLVTATAGTVLRKAMQGGGGM